jgi:hypothetical protein
MPRFDHMPGLGSLTHRGMALMPLGRIAVAVERARNDTVQGRTPT